MKRRYEDELHESMAQMSLRPKKLMLEMDILPPINMLQPEPQLPKFTLNPEHSQLILYKSIPPPTSEPLDTENLQDTQMEWEQ